MNKCLASIAAISLVLSAPGARAWGQAARAVRPVPAGAGLLAIAGPLAPTPGFPAIMSPSLSAPSLAALALSPAPAAFSAAPAPAAAAAVATPLRAAPAASAAASLRSAPLSAPSIAPGPIMPAADSPAEAGAMFDGSRARELHDPLETPLFDFSLKNGSRERLALKLLEKLRRAREAAPLIKSVSYSPGVPDAKKGSPAEGRFAEDRKYRHDLFNGDDEKYAEARKKLPYLNRYQWIAFSPAGRAVVMLTDIPNPGGYEIKGDKVRVRLKSVDADGREAELEFALAKDGKSLTDSQGRRWERVEKQAALTPAVSAAAASDDEGFAVRADQAPLNSPRRTLPLKLSLRADPTELGALSLSVKFVRTTTSQTTRALFARLGIESLRYEQASGGYWLLSSAPTPSEAARLALLLAAEDVVSEIEIGEAAARLVAQGARAGARQSWRLKVRESDFATSVHQMKVRVKHNALQADVDRAFSGLEAVRLSDDAYVIILPRGQDSTRIARTVARLPVTTAVFVHPELLARLNAAPAQAKAVRSLVRQLPDAVLLDWDDTLADEKELADAATLELFRHFHLPAPALAEARRQWAADHAVFYSRFFPGIPRKTLDDAWNAISERFRRGETVNGRRFARAILFPDTIAVLEALKKLGIPLAVVSNKNEDALLREIAESGLGHYFKHVYGHKDGRLPKPSPQSIDETLKTLRVKPDNAWYIGDQLSDMEAARAAGMKRIHIGREGAPDGEIVHLQGLRQLLSILRKLPDAALRARVESDLSDLRSIDGFLGYRISNGEPGHPTSYMRKRHVLVRIRHPLDIVNKPEFKSGRRAGGLFVVYEFESHAGIQTMTMTLTKSRP